MEKFEQLDIFTGEKAKEYPKNPGENKRKREKRVIKAIIEEGKRRIEKGIKKSL